LRALAFIEDGMTVGLGTGTTADFATDGLARRVAAEGLRLRCVPTSEATARRAEKLGLPLLDLNDITMIDVTIDGADEVDAAFNLIKGAGGAHTREKLVARATRLELIVVDECKVARYLGEKFPVPVEVLPFAWQHAQRLLEALGCMATLRGSAAAPFRTDNGNAVLDCDFGAITDPAALEARIKALPGVVESGLFVGLVGALVVGTSEGVEVRMNNG